MYSSFKYARSFKINFLFLFSNRDFMAKKLNKLINKPILCRHCGKDLILESAVCDICNGWRFFTYENML
jgi:hypothetical protein